MALTTWRKEIKHKMESNGETWNDVVGTAPHDMSWPNATFDSGFGGSEGIPFTVWTHNFVYFPGVYDGAEWADSVPRDPNGVATRHVGGE